MGHFHRVISTEFVRSSGHHSNLVVEALDRAGGNLGLNLYSEIRKSQYGDMTLTRLK